ncbi:MULTISPECIES: TRAP transporter small permease [unclassified Azospirillum]|uniref:TRAP transporter small permease n=1 Tax=unclassified Azospirillum TaxID=2630922 RepID=UPI000D643B26|nr:MULTISPECIES: TRAP transporter small permease [unclassified Azospirillum]
MIDLLDRGLLRFNRAAVGALLGLMTLLVFANVVLRYLFELSLPWVEELTRFMMIWVAYLGAGLALRAGAHVSVDLLQDAVAPRLARIMRIAVALSVLVFLVTVAWYGWIYAQFTMRQTSPVLELPLGAVYLAIPIGCALMALHLLLSLRSFVLRDFAAEREEDGITEPTPEAVIQPNLKQGSAA